MTLGTRKPGDGWFHLARDRFYRVWLATLGVSLLLALLETPLALLGLAVYFLLCPLGLVLVVLYLYRCLITQECVLDLELGQVLRVSTWPTRSLVPMVRLEDLTGVALAAEETESVWVAQGPEATAEQVVYLLRDGRPLPVSRFKFAQRADALRQAQDLSELLEVPLRLGGPQERLVRDADGQIRFVPYSYEAPWKRAAITLGMFLTWPGLAVGLAIACQALFTWLF